MDNPQTEIFADKPGRPWFTALKRGFSKRCPKCGTTRLFNGYSKTSGNCANCGLDFAGHQADDAPPYFTIIVIGHIAIPMALAVKQVFDPPMWAQFGFWIPAVALAIYWLLPASKGALIGLQWANKMHGFGSEPGESATPFDA